MAVELTKKFIQSLCPDSKPLEISDTTHGLILRLQPTGRLTFYFAYRAPDGNKKRIKIGLYESIGLPQARELARKHAGEVACGRDPQETKKQRLKKSQKAEVETLKGFIDAHYHAWVTRHRKSANHTLMLLDRYFSPWNQLPMMDITRQRIERWRLQELSRGVKPSSVNRSLNSLRSVLSQAVEHGVLERSPLERLKKLKEYDETRIRYLSDEEEARLIGALAARNYQLIQKRQSFNRWRLERRKDLLPDIPETAYADYLYPMVIICLDTGMRRGELFELAWSDVDFETELITVRAAVAKSGKVRRIPLTTATTKALKRWQESPTGTRSGLVFPGREGKPLTDVKTAWSSLLKAADIQDFRFHDMRHHFASRLVTRGAPLNAIRELLGHADLKTTLRYAHLGPNQLVDAIKLLEPPQK